MATSRGASSQNSLVQVQHTASSADLEEGDDDIDDEDDDDDQDDDDDDVGNDGPLTRPSRNDGQGTFLGHGSVERGLEQRVGNRFAEV